MPKSAAISNNLVDAFLGALDVRMNELLTESNDVLPALVDTVSIELLPVLATQFNALGYKGWKLAETEAQKRQLIKDAIGTARYRGTLLGIRRALESVGFFSATISEHVPAKMNGFLQMNGATTMGSLDWAHFAALVDLGAQAGVSVGLITDLRAMIDTAKNARSLLVNIAYAATLSDDTIASESNTFAASVTDSDTVQTLFLNGLYTMNGAINMSSNGESLVVAVVIDGFLDSIIGNEGNTDLKLSYTDGTVMNTTF